MKKLFLEVGGRPYDGWTSALVSKSMETLSGIFSFSATSDDILKFPIATQSECRILVGEEPVITGFIEKIDINSDAGTHTITLSGRDKTADIIDSSLDESITFNTRISLVSVIERVIEKLGLKDEIFVLDDVGGLKDFQVSELVSSSLQETAFEFIEKYCRKRQVLISSNGDGNIVLQRASGDFSGASLIRRANEQKGTVDIKLSSVSYDYTNRFNKVTVKSQFNPSRSDSTTTNNSASEFDNKIRPWRQTVLIAETSSDNLTAKDRAIWEVNVRRARSKIYTATVVGYTTELEGDEIWRPNTLVNVIDDYASIEAEMLIKDVQYSLSQDGGSETILTLVSKDAFTLQAELDEATERANQLGRNVT